jgi:hypothetical protein
MADEIEVSPEALRLVAHYFRMPSEKAKIIFGHYESVTGGLMYAIGDDESGQKFAEVYVPANKSIIEAGASMSEGMLTFEQDYNLMADNYDKTNNANSS